MPTPRTAVQKQIRLPISKAVEIAWKNIRMRLSRSMLVTSGIVLAIAFLLAIQINDAIVDGMRRWIGSAPKSVAFVQLRAQQHGLDEQLRALRPQIRDAALAAPAAPKDAPAFDVPGVAGKSLDELRAELGAHLPDTAKVKDALTTDHNGFRARFRDWLALERKWQQVTAKVSEPDKLQSLLDSQGVKTEAAEVKASKLQQNWLLGLALLVAFVGILNSMLMSVTERFREIGTMKCLGALDGFIVKLFLIESLFQGIVGTFVGTVLGLLISLVMSWATYGHFAFVNVPWGDIGFAVLASAIVGVLLTVCGAVWPAWQAARMHPIEAMRVEA